ncbi:MAG: urease accessory protein UreD [Okeania sp. SIO2G4]|uniref:urease accessory protein UreD n=1 Tax=unclassified Okeania TaxID=2634635 RepID=UPI0013BB1F6F|nr:MULTISPECIES: urease accessory protein UreD [unclassified Okeania]NEP07577.1 urease accessory protein UreD [Okeania sp. SIO4D6]NEP43934.1 urease accessory protein UreD [Okeania sp. SIO2H7]NEP73463.1 urease accessory protein UreD [Okeania sp. SIO2G5]NEP94181.1 urease accessory protein UreD [Okeania sp. SIO2F5]NEQ92135.1 urease accessory protein UreD [Okeania sp. SIO2G4]
MTKQWHGSLDLIYGKQHNTTQILASKNQAPLKIQRPFYPEGNEVCHSVILHTAGGVVGDDRLSINIELQPTTHVLITTAAASKIYRSNGQLAQQNISINLDSQSCLEWFPQPTILFNGAEYRQDLKVHLGVEASWMSWEIIRFGRSARGEKFLTGNWRSYTEVWQENYPIWIDRQCLKGGSEMVNSLLGLADNSVVGTFIFVGQPVTAEVVTKVRDLWQSLGIDMSGEAGVTRIPKGMICRYCGQSIINVKNWFNSVWHFLRLFYLKRPSCSPRVWS